MHNSAVKRKKKKREKKGKKMERKEICITFCTWIYISEPFSLTLLQSVVARTEVRGETHFCNICKERRHNSNTSK